MTDCKLKQEIKKILTDGQLWLHQSDLDLTVESLNTLIDREKIKELSKHKDLVELRIERRGLGDGE